MYLTLPRIKRGLLLLACGWATILLVTHLELLKHHRKSDFEASRILAGNLRRITCNGHVTNIRDRLCVKRFNFHKENSGNVTKSDCHLLAFLVYIERICPQPRDYDVIFRDVILDEDDVVLPRAYVRQNLYDVTNQLNVCGKACEWIRARIERTKLSWAETSLRLAREKSLDHGSPGAGDAPVRRAELRVLAHMGLLTPEFGLNFGAAALAGGPLGELVQWSDVIAALHVLGHDVTVSWSPSRLRDVITGSDHVARRFDLVLTDLVGFEQMRIALGSAFHYRCVTRILDVYGTEPAFNHPLFNPDRGNPRTWGGRGLDPRQFFTHFPHSDDNSFLGFVVAKNGGIGAPEGGDRKVALLYGKTPDVLRGGNREKFIAKLSEHFEVHATMRIKEEEDGDVIPPYVINHENLSQEKFMKLLGKSRVFVGLGWPLEGPAPLEAVASGVTFINPVFSQPRSVGEAKPTKRKLTSQNPYAETRIGEPWVHTLDIRDLQQVDGVLTQILGNPRNEPHVPFEFTMFGFLERLNAYVENQDFCGNDVKIHSSLTMWFGAKKKWPPLTSLKVISSRDGESCSAACSRREMACERSFFGDVNSEKFFREVGLECSRTERVFPREEMKKDPRDENGAPIVPCHAPSYDVINDVCATQTDPLLFSCACTPPAGVTRVCPCREFGRQMSLCLTCS